MKNWLCAWLAGAATIVQVAAAAEAVSPTVELNIPAQEMGDALNQFGHQSGLIVMMYSSLAQGVRSPALKGSYTAAQALDRLLERTDLVYEFIDERTVAIRPAKGIDTASGRRISAADPEREQGMQTVQERSSASDTPQAGASISSTRESEQAAREEPIKIEEIVVTAQKRAERLQDVPVSISVLRGEELDKSTARDVTEMLSRVPGVAVQHGEGGTQVPVRGVGAGVYVGNGSSPTAYYLDGIPFGFVKSALAPNPGAYDLERIEVLRGPQGTLYGASALNGVVRVLTKDADPHALDFKARTSASTTQRGGNNYRGDVAINVPIVEGKLAARAVVGYQNWSGWIDKPLINQKDINDAEMRTMRLKLNAQPTEQLALGLSVWSARDDYGGNNISNRESNRLVVYDEPYLNDFDAYGFKIGYDFSRLSVDSVTSYLKYATDYQGGGSQLIVNSGQDAKTLAQEVSLTSTHGGSWRWSAGGLYRDSKEVGWARYSIYPATSEARDHSNSYALFGELTRIFLGGQWELTGGLRYFKDDVDYRELSTLFGPPAQPIVADSTFDFTAPRFVLAWHPNEQLNLYASYGKGFRSGWNQNPTVLQLVPFFPPVRPDSLANYELGMKGGLFNRRLSFDAALYFMDWQDVQQFLLVFVPGLDAPLVPGINGQSASGMGFDFSLTATPVDALELTANFSWNDLVWDADVVSPVSGRIFSKGDRLNNSAEYTFGGSADYVLPLGRNGLEGRFSVSANYTSELLQRGSTAIGGVGDPIFISRASASVHASNRWSASLYVDNLNNEGDATWRPAVGPPDRRWRLRPRTVGVQFEYGLGR